MKLQLPLSDIKMETELVVISKGHDSRFYPIESWKKRSGSRGATRYRRRRRCRTRRTRRWNSSMEAFLLRSSIARTCSLFITTIRQIVSIECTAPGRRLMQSQQAARLWNIVEHRFPASCYPLLLIVRLIRSGRRLGWRWNTRLRYRPLDSSYSVSLLLLFYFSCQENNDFTWNLMAGWRKLLILEIC